MMKMIKLSHFLLVLLNAFALGFFVNAQNYNQSGFISIDCGLPRNSNYTVPSTTLNYISDADFITTGTVHSIANEYKTDTQEQFKTLRSFPEGTRNCYKINVTARTRHLIRASFYHGNYDGQNTAPKFDLHIGGNYWDTVKFRKVSIISIKEIIHITPQSYASVCVVNTGFGTPFISALEFRPMSDQAYYNNTGTFESLSLVYRMDIGSTKDFAYRFPYDIVDRYWYPFQMTEYWNQINTSQAVDVNGSITYRAPSIVMSSMASPLNESEPLVLYWNAPDTVTNYYFYLHFAELQQLKANQSRAIVVTSNRDQFSHTVVPRYLRSYIVYNTFGSSGLLNHSIFINKLDNSTLPPILNAFELYSALDLSQYETDENDVDVINNIKSAYGVKQRNWNGDPCFPMAYMWTGLNCSNDRVDPPRIISLNLSSSGLTGEISTHMSKLLKIESLDLSNNSLSGSVPEFLSLLPNLRFLNLERNNLSGSVPVGLIEKVNTGVLSLSVGENINLCTSSECNGNKEAKKRNNIIIPIVSSVGVVVLLLVGATFLVGLKQINQASKRKNGPFKAIKRQYTYAEVQKMTNNFERVLGKGGFGEVYYGLIDENTEVAVKVLSSSSSQGYQQFEAEVNLLMKVYHGNLTNLVGYCYEDSYMALIYEYMANGDLASHLSGDSSTRCMLSWEGRLQIAIDAAQGLEYLHHGCKPPIIHRDIKTANILLTNNFRAKIADFGLSRSFTADSGTHVSTNIVGTYGYLDPKYRETGWLNEKSDVYSFGVVLLAIITSRTPLLTNSNDPNEKIHISKWVRSIASSGVISNVVDPELRGDFDTNSIWKAVEVGMACASESPTRRPNMSEVVSELKDCLVLENARKNNHSRIIESNSDPFKDSPTLNSEFLPFAR